MKTIIYILTAIMISSLLFSAIPFNHKNTTTCISLKCTDDNINEKLMDESAKIIENRLKDFGLKTTRVTISGSESIIEICFKKEINLLEVSPLLTSKGKFEFYETVDRKVVLKHLNKDNKLFSLLNIPESNSKTTIIPNSVLGYGNENSISESNKLLESLTNEIGEEIKFAPSKFKNKENNISFYLLKPSASLKGNSISDVKNGKDKKSGLNFISMNFDDEATKKWAEITRKNVGKIIAIVLDDQVYSAPIVNSEIKGGRSMISGKFSSDETAILTALIKNGELPLEFEIVK